MTQILRRTIYFLISIILLSWLAQYFRIVDICIWLFNTSMPLILAFIFRFLLDPCIKYFHKVDRRVVCVLTYLCILLILLGLFYFLMPRIVENCMDFYKQYDDTNGEGSLHPILKTVYDFLVSFKLFDVVKNLVNSMANSITYWFTNIVIAFGISFYLVFDNIKVSSYIKNTNTKYKDQMLYIIKEVKTTTFAFLKASFFDFMIFFVVSYFVFKWLGLQNASYIALFLALTNLIAYIGPYIGGIPVIIYAFTLSSFTGYIAVLVIVVLQVVESTFIQPLLFKQCIKINPIALFIALSVFGDWFGIVGMLIAPLLLGYINIIKKVFDDNTNIERS